MNPLLHARGHCRARILRPSVLLGAAVLALSAPNLRAVMLDFEAASGYIEGALDTQRQTGTNHSWRGPNIAANPANNVLRVTADGVGGQYLKAFAMSGSAQPNHIFDTTAADLGGTFDNTASRVAFSFDFRFDDAFGTTLSSSFRFYLGNTNGAAVTLELLNDGRMYFNNGATSTSNQARTADNSVFRATTGVWFTVSGIVDYRTQTYSLAVNGVGQAIGSDTFFGFRNAGRSDQNATVLMRDMAASSANFVGYSVDNVGIALAPIPEPSSLALAAGAAAGVFALRRRRAV